MKNFPLKRIVFSIAVMTLGATTSWAQPAIRAQNGVVNASSYTADIARGSWFVVFGSGLGPATISVYSGALPYPTELSGTKVSFTPAGGGTAVDTRLWYTLAGQVAAMLPSSTPAGDYDVKVTYSGQTSAASRVKVVERNFGYATQAQNGQGPAQATQGDGSLNRFTSGTLGTWKMHPAKPGDTVVLWGTGLGADQGSDLDGTPSGDMTSVAQVKVTVGGIDVTPAYAGRSGGSPGLDQVNFTVPANVTTGCSVSLQVTAGGRTSNLGSIAVAEAGKDACTHPVLSQDQLAKLDQGGSVAVGYLGLSKIASKLTIPPLGSIESTSESVSGSFSKYGVDTVGSANFSLVQIGQCFVLKRTGTTDQVTQGIISSPLDAGAQLTLNGPNASNKAVPRDKNNYYSLTLYSSGFMGIGGTGSPTLTQGNYTIAGPGGADVGAFTANVDFPGTFTWANRDSIADPIPRSSGLTINWTGGGSGLVTIAGTAMKAVGGTTQNPVVDATLFTCVAPASAGNFTVPTSVLQQLPPASSDTTSGSYGTLSVFTIPDVTTGQGVFTAPNLDKGFLTYSVGSLKSTGWN